MKPFQSIVYLTCNKNQLTIRIENPKKGNPTYNTSVISYKRCLIVGCFLLFNISKLIAQIHIIPQPVSVASEKGNFFLTKKCVISVDKESESVGNYLRQYLISNYHLNLKVKVYTHVPLHAVVKLISIVNKGGVEPAYSLVVKTNGITIIGKKAGLFYGVQSFLQLIPDNNGSSLKILTCKIHDQPRFSWRGLSLDVSRHFFTVPEVEKYLDVMAHYKLNVFHWHLTDDEGWRIQIDKYPLLTDVGSKITYWESQGKFRKLDNLIGGGRDGYYTKDDIREVVKYANDRFINILPEIEMPGHSEAAIFAYPELGCKDSTSQKHRVRMLDPSEYTFKFYEDVLTEVIPLFPNQYIHIGGDEANMTAWLNSPTAVALMKKEKLKNEREIQSYFIKRIETFLISKNKKLIGWDEILAGGLAPSATVMSWQGEAGGISAAKLHHDVVMTPLPQMYFDAPQGKASTEPPAWNDPVSWQMVYNYDPLPNQLSAKEDKFILGAQANIWTERIPNINHLEYMVYPRLLALAELTWTPKADRNLQRFEQSMYQQYRLFNLWNINGRLPNVKGIQDIITNLDEISFTLTHPLKNLCIQYGFNTKKPDTATKIQEFPIKINATIKDSLLVSAFLSQKNNSKKNILQTMMIRHIKIDSFTIMPDTLSKGLTYILYKTTLSNYSKLDTIKNFISGVYNKNSFAVPLPDILNTWVKLTGFLKIETDDEYKINSEFETSPFFFLNKKTIIYGDNNKYAEPQSAILYLKKGYYQLSGYYILNSENSQKIPISIKTANGKLLDIGKYFWH